MLSCHCCHGEGGEFIWRQAGGIEGEEREQDEVAEEGRRGYIREAS